MRIVISYSSYYLYLFAMHAKLPAKCASAESQRQYIILRSSQAWQSLHIKALYECIHKPYISFEERQFIYSRTHQYTHTQECGTTPPSSKPMVSSFDIEAESNQAMSSFEGEESPFTYWCMDWEELEFWVNNNPGKVNDLDARGYTVLSAAACKTGEDSVSWLVDTKGADVNRQTVWGRNALFSATSSGVVSFLLRRGANPVLRDKGGWTPLMWHAYVDRGAIVGPLLEDPRVIEAINVQATNSTWEGCSALHIACKGRKLHKVDASLVDQLLRAGADVKLKNDDGDMAIDLFERYNFHARFRKAAISLLEHAMQDQPYMLSLARHQVHSFQDVCKIAGAKTTTEERQAACIEHAPSTLKKRIAAGDALPAVVMGKKRYHRPWEQSAAEAAKEETLVGVLEYVVGLKEQEKDEERVGLKQQEKKEESVDEERKDTAMPVPKEGEGTAMPKSADKEGKGTAEHVPIQGLSDDLFVELLLMMGAK